MGGSAWSERVIGKRAVRLCQKGMLGWSRASAQRLRAILGGVIHADWRVGVERIEVLGALHRKRRLGRFGLCRRRCAVGGWGRRTGGGLLCSRREGDPNVGRCLGRFVYGGWWRLANGRIWISGLRLREALHLRWRRCRGAESLARWTDDSETSNGHGSLPKEMDVAITSIEANAKKGNVVPQ